MKKTLSRKHITITALTLVCVMLSGIGASYAYFTDRATDTATASMATVDIELSGDDAKSYTITDGDSYSFSATATITNNSNIPTYMRAGVILEVTDANDNPVIADTSGITITITSSTQGWTAVPKTITDNGITYEKWFLEYKTNGTYTPVAPGTSPNVAFTVTSTGIPTDCKLTVNTVPEAIQADVDKDALGYLQDTTNVNPAW